MSSIPFILYGDGPRLSSGLARIARDLAIRLVAEQDALGIRFAQVGVDWPGGWHFQRWDFLGFQPSLKDQGREAVDSAIVRLQEETGERPIVLMIMDPARCFDLLRGAPTEDPEVEHYLAADFWGYYPLDAQNRQGAVGGPAGRAIVQTNRLLGYGRYGADVLRSTQAVYQEESTPLPPPVEWLPHGIDTSVFHPRVPLVAAEADWQAWARAAGGSGVVKVGCVATNQPRKDLGLLFSAVAEIKAQGHPIAVWLHTDKLTNAWDIGELVRTCGLRREEVAVSTEDLTDAQLAARYAWSDVTFACGLGEGYGYPIVESLACGTPCVHGNYAGGVELIPEPSWLVEPVAWRLESVYALLRPVFSPKDVGRALVQAADLKRTTPAATKAYCSGAVAYLDWNVLWGRWRQWITEGLQARRTT